MKYQKCSNLTIDGKEHILIHAEDGDTVLLSLEDAERLQMGLKDTLERATFRTHLKKARTITDSWPEWKQNLLGKASSPTVSEPRKNMNEADY